MDNTLSDKLYYKIGEVAQIAGVKTSVLRFWETEFNFLRPEKSSTGQRLYTKQVLNLVLQVRRLLYDEKFTIEGVKKRFSLKGKLLKRGDIPVDESEADYRQIVKDIRKELQLMRSQLS